ncbi:MAG: hypothetical protein IPM08_10375 [Actinomycetales bacterium]|nr:hypothetical protein [Actinomycetales bacterium]
MTSSPASSDAGPLRQVLGCLGGGVRDRREVAVRTGLAPDVVDSAIETLTRLGLLTATPLGSGCPDQGCGSCGSGRADATAGCGAPGPGPGANRGPVALTLTSRHRSGRAGA